MMMNLDARWKGMKMHAEGTSFQRIDDTHPLDFYIGKDLSGELALLLISSEKVVPLNELESIQITCRKRADEKWALMFRLEKPVLSKLFALLCEDLVESSRGNPDPLHPSSFVLSRFVRWQRLLQRGHSGLLDNDALRGLVGELIFLETYVIQRKGVREALIGWCGPNGADRDFRFHEDEYEVKTVHESSDRLLISSAEQLDLTEKNLELAVIILDDVAPECLEDSFTILDQVKRLREKLVADTVSLDIFENQLVEAGFVDRDEYAERAFIFGGTRIFRVTPDFPAIRRSSLVAGIGNVRWELFIKAILPFEVTNNI